MRNLKKFIIAAAIASAIPFCTFALPGTYQYIADKSGEYVYYSDKSFSRPSILGFLYYSESAYALRYYAPADIKNHLPEKDITLYFSADPDAKHLELTGENIIGATSQDDTDIINYMHDMFYEFTARAQKTFLTSNNIVESRQDFEQFGGKVIIVFNPQIPLFNIESIKSADGTKILSVLTTGALTSSADKSFTNYKGDESIPKDKNRNFKKMSSAKSATASFGSQSIKLTTQWTQKIENLWVMDDYALLTMNSISVPEDYKNNQKLFEDIMTRMFSESTTDSYILWPQKGVSNSKGQITMTNVYYQPDTKDVTREFKIITKCKDGTYAYLSLTVFESIYQKNKAYFDSIIKSYNVK